MLSDVLKKDILQFFSRSALEKGTTYKVQKRVSALEFSDNFSHIRARVAGSARKPYAVDIVLKFDRERLIDIDGECSCPVGLNCKHVAATLLEGLSDTGAQIDAELLPIKSSARLLEVQVVPHELNDWLERIDSAIRGNDYPAEVTQRILYHLQLYAREGRMPHLAVSLLSVRMRKDGSRSNQISRPNLSSLNPDKAPAHYRGSIWRPHSCVRCADRPDSRYDLRSGAGAAPRAGLRRHHHRRDSAAPRADDPVA